MKTIAIFGAILGLTSVIMGAASDHIFSGLITAENSEHLNTALRYHQLYAILIFCLGLYQINTQPNAAIKWISYLFCAGTILFCGSLYISLIPGLDKAVMLTPVGGTALICAWFLIILVLLRMKDFRHHLSC